MNVEIRPIAVKHVMRKILSLSEELIRALIEQKNRRESRVVQTRNNAMSSFTDQPLPTKIWRELYVAALLEPDKDKIALLIVKAEQAIIARARDLFTSPGDHIEEQEALDDALYALHALKNCVLTDDKSTDAS